ncbi:MAG: phosphatase [Cyclobacteriaceae bacterium]|nr:phosphatase [Cyclobacteriaceae bacterium]MCB9236599.1 phosphatase [Flammeovirgaceae bacterium]MCB0500801.1 phosphatase [Cyclobacteriaceae bacterium]MCO5273077.1 phosphatase [Cyclobacteriaceae bacterium]MCW5903264.1 phosphatase [Cyclobacteriaceae bacterium]
MKLAAIDIGSNAIRFQISTVLDRGPKALFKKLEYIRFPLRLGHDVFSTGKISKESEARFMKLMSAYKIMIELYEADDYMFCATSAMRESKNGKKLAERVQNELGLTIRLISGKEEADLTNRAIRSYLTDHTYLHIDVGGGSTELNLYLHGKKIKTRSFKVGSVRVLERTDLPVVWADMEKWIKSNVRKAYGRVIAVGTGGNISKIFALAGKKPGKTISLNTVKEIRDRVEALSIEQRIYELQMNPDRADVIIPASNIYIKVMEWAHAQSILVPDVGLKDGMLLYLLEKNQKQQKIGF